MQLYHFTNRFPDEAFDPEIHHSKFAGTRADAKDFIKTIVQTDRVNHFVELVEVDNSKQGVLDLLGGKREFKVLARWKFTSRGALRECDEVGRFIGPVEQ